MKCKHEHAIEWRGAVTAEPGHISTDRLVHLLDGKSATRMTHRICADCDAWLPLGPSSDDSDAVRVEMRAAEIAADDAMFNWEEFGWGCHEHGLDPDFTESSCFAGYLARVIATHDENERGWSMSNASIRHLQERLEEVTREADLMRPVYQAALAWFETEALDITHDVFALDHLGSIQDLKRAVYEAKKRTP